MEKIYYKLIFYMLIIIGSFTPFIFGSAAANNIVINEIAWMGTKTSASDEWIELKNNTDQEIDLAGWTLKAIDNTPEITLSGTIAAYGYFLLERTDNNSISNITADQIYTGALNNSGENLELRDGGNNLIDSIDASDGWPAGDNSTKQTMEKINSTWQTSLDYGGTPKALNSSDSEESSQEQETSETEETASTSWIPPTVVNHPPIAKAGPDITALVNQEISFDASQSSDLDNDELTFFWNFGDGASDAEKITSHIYSYPGQYLVSLLVSDGELSNLDIITISIYDQSVIISEFMPNPEGNDRDFEWIELFNQSNQVANISNWQIDDQEGGSKPFILPDNTLIGPKQFLVLTRLITKISLNNDQDQVRLIYPDGSIANQIEYKGEKKQGFSIAFDGQGYFWTKIPTPGSANIISSVEIKQNTSNASSNNPTPVIQVSQDNQEVLANINLNSSQNFSSIEPDQEQASPSAKSADSSSQQSAQLAQITQPLDQSGQKSSLILILSIIIAGSLLTSWFLISLKKKLKQ